MWWLLLACAVESTVPAGETGKVSVDDTSSPGDTGADSGDTAAPLDLADWVAAGVGTWTGRARETPVGDMAFRIQFEATDAGLSGTTANGAGFSLSFTYAVDNAGAWTLTETGTLPGDFTQTQVLAPVSRDGARVVWRSVADPDYLEVVVDHAGDTLVMEANVRGETHAVLDLARG